MKTVEERKSDAAALIEVARHAGIAVDADEFGRGTFLFSSVEVLARLVDATRSETKRHPLTRAQIESVMTEHYPLDSLLRENVDSFEASVRDIERLHGITPNTEAMRHARKEES